MLKVTLVRMISRGHSKRIGKTRNFLQRLFGILSVFVRHPGLNLFLIRIVKENDCKCLGEDFKNGTIGGFLHLGSYILALTAGHCLTSTFQTGVEFEWDRCIWVERKKPPLFRLESNDCDIG